MFYLAQCFLIKEEMEYYLALVARKMFSRGINAVHVSCRFEIEKTFRLRQVRFICTTSPSSGYAFGVNAELWHLPHDVHRASA